MLIYTLCVSGLEGTGGGRRGGGASDCTGVWRVGLSVIGKQEINWQNFWKQTRPSFEKGPIWNGRENICETVGECEHFDNSERDDEDDCTPSSWLRVNMNFPVFWICMLCRWRQTNGRTDGGTDGQMKGRRDGRRIKHSADITGIEIEMGWHLREDGSPQDACSITTRCM